MAGGEKKRGTTIWIVLVCIIAAMGSSYTMLRFMGGSGERPAASAKAVAETFGPVFDAGVFTVDLVPESRTRLLRVSVTLQTASDAVLKDLESREAQVKDMIVTILRSRTPSSVTGRQGMDSLRREIRDTINNRISHGGITDVYFPDLVMQ